MEDHGHPHPDTPDTAPDLYDTPGARAAFQLHGLTHSMQINEIADAMSAAQEKIVNPTFDSANPHYGSKYASLAQVLHHIREACKGLGLTFTQHPCSKDGLYGCETLVMHKSGQWIRSELLMRPERGSNAHASSACVTYCKRVAAQAIFCIAADEDDDGNAAITPDKTAVAPQRAVPDGDGEKSSKAAAVMAFRKWTGGEPEEMASLIQRCFKREKMRQKGDKYSDAQWKKLLGIATEAMEAGVAYMDKYPALEGEVDQAPA